MALLERHSVTTEPAPAAEKPRSGRRRGIAAATAALALVAGGVGAGFALKNRDGHNTPSAPGISAPKNPGEALTSHNGIDLKNPYEQIMDNESGRATLAKILGTTPDELDNLIATSDQTSTQWFSPDGRTTVYVGIGTYPGSSIDVFEIGASGQGGKPVYNRLWMDGSTKGSRYAAYQDNDEALQTGQKGPELVSIFDERSGAVMVIMAGPVREPSGPNQGPASGISYDSQNRAAQLAAAFHQQ